MIAFPEGSAIEIVEDGVNGLIARDEAEMIEKIRHLDRIDRQTCRETFERHFTAQRMVKDHVRLYEEILSADNDSANAA